MLRYAAVTQKPRIFLALSGLTIEAFHALLPAFVAAEAQAHAQHEAQRPQPRRRRPGGGRTPRLATPADRLLFILVYFKLYPLQEVQGFLFGLSQPQANTWIYRLTPLLNAALGREQQLPARTPASLAQVLDACPALEFLIDATERPIQRPRDAARQRDCYSGKQRQHTVKNVLIVERARKKIHGLSRTRPGRMHDKRIADDEGYRFPAGSQLWQDSGFQGYAPAGAHVHQPQKKPPKQALTVEQGIANRAVSQVRIRVEHAIGGAKVFHIARDTYRNRRLDYEDLLFETACGLHNFRCEHPCTR